MAAIMIIERNINNFKRTFTNKTQLAQATEHNILGQITIAVELGAISLQDAEKYIDIVFNAYEDLEP